jgi:hypothetical protein
MESAGAYTASLFDKGLISADDTDIENAQQLSLKLDGAGIGNLSRLFRGIATDIENMRAKNTAFDPSQTFSALSRIYTTISLILARPSDSEVWTSLVEKSRSVYRTMPLGHFTGLGVHPWQTRSGYAGVTALVYHHEKNAVRSYTVSLADFYEGTQGMVSFQGLKSMLTRGEHWDAGVSLDPVSRSVFTLRNFKLNDEGRLSSSKGTHFSSQGKTTMELIQEIASDFSDAAAEEVYDYFGKKGSRQYRLVAADSIGDCEYDKVNQRLTFTIYSQSKDAESENKESEDEEDEIEDTVDTETFAFINYSAITKNAIEYIEALAKTGFESCWFLGEEDTQGFIPLSMITAHGVENFYFAALRTAKPTKEKP